jgi:uncharacterized protein (DUF983 family)
MTGSNNSDVSPFTAGLKCRCPGCGRGKLFQGVLTVAPECSFCGLDLAAQDSGDGPAVFVIFIVGALAVALAFFVEFTFFPPVWAHLIYQIPFVLGASILLLRPMKATLIAIQYKNKVGGFD